MKNIRPTNVNAYIAAAPAGVRAKLREMRAAIQHTAPQAMEKISYGMPYYAYEGRLAYFVAFKLHIGLYIPGPVIADHASKLKKYETSTGTVRFPLDQRLPIQLIKSLIQSRVKKNLARAREK